MPEDQITKQRFYWGTTNKIFIFQEEKKVLPESGVSLSLIALIFCCHFWDRLSDFAINLAYHQISTEWIINSRESGKIKSCIICKTIKMLYAVVISYLLLCESVLYEFWFYSFFKCISFTSTTANTVDKYPKTWDKHFTR